MKWKEKRTWLYTALEGWRISMRHSSLRSILFVAAVVLASAVAPCPSSSWEWRWEVVPRWQP